MAMALLAWVRDTPVLVLTLAISLRLVIDGMDVYQLTIDAVLSTWLCCV